MAKLLVNDLVKSNKDRNTVHNPVAASYSVFDLKGIKHFQIDTFGQPDRKFKGKCSQTLQIDRDDAIQLIRLIMKELDITLDDLITFQQAKKKD